METKQEIRTLWFDEEFIAQYFYTKHKALVFFEPRLNNIKLSEVL